MKKKIFTLALFLLTLLSATAQGSLQRPVGYSVTEEINISGARFGTAGTYSIGAFLDSDFMAEYRNCRIIGMKVAAGADLGRSRMFLYDMTADGPQLLHEQNQRLYTGWNEISFSGNGYTISGEENYFFGFDYVETDEMVAAGKGGIATVGNDSTGAFMLMQNDALYSVTGAGMLCVQLIVDVTNLPTDKAAFTFFDPGYRYKKPTETFELTTIVRNSGRDEFNTYTMAYRFDDLDPVYEEIDKPLASGASETWEIAVPIPAELGIGAHTITAWVDKVNGQTPGSLCSRTARFGIYNEEMPRRRMFVEVYADQNSYHSAKFENMLDITATHLGTKADYVKIFAPGNSLAVPEAEYLHDLYAYTLPSFTVNRSYFPCEAHVAYDMNDYLFQFPDDLITSILDEIIEFDFSSVCFGDINLGGNYDDATREFTVNVTGTLLDEATAIHGDMAVTLMLVEDGVVAPQTAVNSRGMAVTDNSFVHNNVLRGFMTAPRGDRLTLSGQDFSATFTTTIDPAWNANKLRVVATLAPVADELTADNLTEWDITNATSASVTGIAAISNVVADNQAVDGPAEYFTLDGRRAVEPLTPGFYIKRLVNGMSSKILVK